jgi:catalase
MALRNPVGRVNYEPNSWGTGPREDPVGGFQSFASEEGGAKRRVRAELFADHYSQARQFWNSQAPVEQRHIVDAYVFELSKVETPAIRRRMVANLRNVAEELAADVAAGLRLELPDATDPARPVIGDLAPSPALSILRNGPADFGGRKLGVLVTDGTEAAVFNALGEAVGKVGAVLEVIAPAIGGVELDDGTWLEAQQKIDGGPSVLYDAVAVIPSAAGANELIDVPAARDFVADAYAHCKFIGFAPPAITLFDAVGLGEQRLDDGFVAVDGGATATEFIDRCAALRHWARSGTADDA